MSISENPNYHIGRDNFLCVSIGYEDILRSNLTSSYSSIFCLDGPNSSRISKLALQCSSLYQKSHRLLDYLT